MTLRYVVYGAGAIGGLVAGLLVKAGEDVAIIARGAHGDAILRNGLTVQTPERAFTVRLPVAPDPSTAGIRDGDAVLLGMKSQDTGSALAALRRVAPSATPIACLQNGVDNERTALRLFEHVYGVCVMCPAAHLEPGVIVGYAAPIPGLLDIGRYPSGTDAISKQVATAFRNASFDSVERADIMRWKHRKLLVNLNNAIEALCRPDGGSWRTESVRRLSAMVQEEGAAVLKMVGVDVVSADEDAARRGDIMSIQPVDGSTRAGGSSWQSLQRSSPSIESDYLNGEIVMLGRQLGMPTPVNSLLQELATEMVVKGSRPGSVSADEILERLPSG